MPSFLGRNYNTGSWFGLPDFGITEKFTANRTAQGGSNFISTNKNASSGTTSNVSMTQAEAEARARRSGIPSSAFNPSSVLGDSVSGGGGSARPAGQNTLYADIQQQQNVGNNQIDSDYENYINELNAQQGEVQGAGAMAEQRVRQAGAEQETAIGRERTQAEQGYSTQEQTVNKQSQSALQQARDLYRQIQQRNIAQLSGSGLSASSVAESLAERLGVETARRIAGITGSRDEVLQNISKERTNINNYLNERLSNVRDDVTMRISEIQQNVLKQVNQINRSKQVASSDRANARAQLLSQAQSQIAQLTADAQNYAQGLQSQMAARAQRLADSQNFVLSSAQGLQNQIGLIQNLQDVGLGGARLPSQVQGMLGQENMGFFQNGIIPRKQDEEDILASLYSQAGVQ